MGDKPNKNCRKGHVLKSEFWLYIFKGVGHRVTFLGGPALWNLLRLRRRVKSDKNVVLSNRHVDHVFSCAVSCSTLWAIFQPRQTLRRGTKPTRTFEKVIFWTRSTVRIRATVTVRTAHKWGDGPQKFRQLVKLNINQCQCNKCNEKMLL